ncbi:MAG: tripartite tricarboxylate transporter TctB family protein [Rhodospirillales bacterium]
MITKARDLWIGVGVMVIGAAFLHETLQIDEGADEITEMMLAPYGISCLVIALGAFQALLGALSAARPNIDVPAESEPARPFRLAAVIGVGVCFIVLFPLIGYMFTSLITLALMMLLFGNRPGTRFAAIAIAGTLVYQIVFVDLMGVHDPAGIFAFKNLLG